MPMRIHVLFITLIAAGCSTHAQSVCQDISYCRTLNTDQERACEMNAKQLAKEASSSGCSSQYDAYFACADDRYDCQGNVPTFTGCEMARADLDSCLAAGRADNACGALADSVNACGGGSPPDPSTPPAACTAADVCSARCYLDNVPDVCLPQPTQLTQAAQCSQQCPL
jgi:hypothetical protein